MFDLGWKWRLDKMFKHYKIYESSTLWNAFYTKIKEIKRKKTYFVNFCYFQCSLVEAPWNKKKPDFKHSFFCWEQLEELLGSNNHWKENIQTNVEWPLTFSLSVKFLTFALFLDSSKISGDVLACIFWRADWMVWERLCITVFSGQLWSLHATCGDCLLKSESVDPE